MSFANLGLLDGLVAGLDRASLHTPTPVQRLAIPALLGGASVVVVARTGSGKTLAYALPMLQRLRAIEDAEGMPAEGKAVRPRGVVVTATRELVDQTVRVLKDAAHAVKLRIRAAAGGLTPSEQRAKLGGAADVIVANPQRLAALVRSGAVDLSDVRMLVVDEADTLLSPGERGEVTFLLDAVKPGTTVAYFSATLPEPIRAWLATRPEKPALLLSKDAHLAPKLDVRNVRVVEAARLDATHDALVARPASERGILFCNRRETADEVGRVLTDRGHAVAVVHGGRQPIERRKALEEFRAGKGRLLVTTELSGRGLHIDGLAFVVNYELPERPSEYLHRIGRVGRQGASGAVINLVTDKDRGMLEQVERIKAGGRLDTGESLRAARTRPPPKEEEPRGRRGAGRAAGSARDARGGPKKR
jgi:ATP-dependent RNA helicase RhlE